MENNFCVYEHWRPDTNECFYVGKGSIKRANSMSARNKLHKAIQKHLKKKSLSVMILIVFNNLSEKEAFSAEIERIAYWRELGGKLANFTDGGEGVSGYKMTDEQKAAMSASRKGRPKTKAHKDAIGAAHKGRKFSDTHRKNLSLALKGKPVSRSFIEAGRAARLGVRESDEIRARKSEAAKKSHAENPRGPEVRKKIGDTQRGVKRKPHSPETLAKMSEKRKAYWANKKANMPKVAI